MSRRDPGRVAVDDPQRFDGFADAYDRSRTLMDQPVWPDLAALGVPEGGRALDVGCGSGHRTVELAEHMDEVVGVDLSAPLIEIARERRPHPRVRLEAVDIRDFVDAAGFDLVVNHNTFHHVAPLAPALDHVRDLVRPGGWAVLTDNVHRDPAWLKWIWSHGGYRLASALDSPRWIRSAGLRGTCQIYRFETSKPWVAHMKSDVYLTPDEFEAAYLAAFPGGAVRHHRLATLTWQRRASHVGGSGLS